VLADGRLGGYPPLHAAHADVLERAGDVAGAAAAWRLAADLTRNSAEQAALSRRAAVR
jgi:RNA polymerase sigma-70 factor (ECF subfamily)